MIIDAHIHLADGFESLPGGSTSELVKDLAKRGIAKAWALTLDGFFGNCKEENDKLKTRCDESNGVFIPFMTVNPRDEQGALEEMERAHYELGMKGLKVHGWVQSFSMRNKWFLEMCKKCVQLKIPLIIHDGTPPYCEPYQVAYVAEMMPDLTIILGHSGLNDLWKEALYAAQRLENIFLCTCSTPYFGVKKMVELVGAHRVLYGSDGGFGDPGIIDNNLDKIYMLGLSDVQLEKVLYKNAEHLLG